MTFVRYVLIQLLAYCIDFGLFIGATSAGFLGPVGANVLGKLAAGFFAFLSHRHFTFKAARAPLLRQSRAYVAVLSLNVPLSSALLASIMFLSEVEPAMAKIIADILGLAFTYTASRLLVFRKNSETSLVKTK